MQAAARCRRAVVASRRASDFLATVVRRIEICMKGVKDSGVQVICDFGIRISECGKNLKFAMPSRLMPWEAERSPAVFLR